MKLLRNQLAMTFCFLGVIAVIAATSATTPHEVMLDRRLDWSQSNRVAPEIEHELLWAVKQSNVSNGVLHNVLMSVSDPLSPKYRQHLSFDQIGDLIRNIEGTRSVEKFLVENGAAVIKVTPHGEYIRAKAPVAVWERILTTQFFYYRLNKHVLGDAFAVPSVSSIIRAPSYTLPAPLIEMVSFVGYASQLPPRRPARLNPVNSTNGGLCTPDLLNRFYNVTNNTASIHSTQSVFETGNQTFSPSDLRDFLAFYNIPATTMGHDIGGHASDRECRTNPDNCGEADLDVQYMMGMAQGADTTYWYIDDTKSAEPFLTWIQDVSSTKQPPLVHSISYGEIETDVTSTILEAFDTEAAKLGARGVTILVSSGDDGVAGFPARGNLSACGFNPSFPASSNYITSVGATQGPEDSQPEIAEQSDKDGLITTGGGFSVYYKQQEWQSSFIKTYFSSVTPPKGKYNSAGRGYPDIALMGHSYNVNLGGKYIPVSGTSASSPVLGGMIALINTYMLEASLPPVGWINPSLYTFAGSIASPFNDINASGENNCAAAGDEGGPTCCPNGFKTATGWDPVTGLGSVNYEMLLEAFVAASKKIPKKTVV